MKREIKFRAWHKNHKVFMDENREKCYIDMDGSICSKGDIGTMRSPESYFPWHRDDHLVLMQYTGLKDKNGVEIYEGDIIPHPTHGNLIVDFEPTMAVFCFWKNKESGLGYPMHFDLHTATWEVIGNICEDKK